MQPEQQRHLHSSGLAEQAAGLTGGHEVDAETELTVWAWIVIADDRRQACYSVEDSLQHGRTDTNGRDVLTGLR